MSGISTHGDVSQEAIAGRFRPIGLIRLTVLAAGSTGVTVAFVSKDWCLTAFSSALAATVLVALLNSILLRSVAARFHWGRWLQLLVVAAIVVVFGWILKIDEQRVFKRVFGIVPPRGIHSLMVDYCLTAPNGDKNILLRFVADRETIDELVCVRNFVRDDKPVQLWLSGVMTWDELWKSFFSDFGRGSGQDWTNVSPMSQPVFYQWDNPEGLLESTRLLWDAENGKAYVLYSLG